MKAKSKISSWVKPPLFGTGETASDERYMRKNVRREDMKPRVSTPTKAARKRG